MSTAIKAAHTPGPWHWRSLHAMAESISDGRMKVVIGSNDQGLCHTCGLRPEEDTANARLIAAAPEMLGALERVYANMLAVYNQASDVSRNIVLCGADGHTFYENTKFAHAAIQKAKGGQ